MLWNIKVGWVFLILKTLCFAWVYKESVPGFKSPHTPWGFFFLPSWNWALRKGQVWFCIEIFQSVLWSYLLSFLFNYGKEDFSELLELVVQRGFWLRLLRAYRSRLRCIRESGWNELSELCFRSLFIAKVAWRSLHGAWLSMEQVLWKHLCLFHTWSLFSLPDNKSIIFFQGYGGNLKSHY